MKLEYFWLVVYGFIAGILAKSLFSKEDEGSFILTIVLGVIGSAIGGVIFNLLGFKIEKGFTLSGLIPAVLGAGLLLFLEKIIKKIFKK